MGSLAPVALGLLALAAPIIALYMLRMRRQERVVSSTLLWERAIRDVRANTPWQKLRPNLLLLLQLLALIALVVALARPFWLGATPLGTNLVVIVDVSGSMSATDVEPSRLERAKDEIRKLIDSLPANGQMTIIAAGSGAEVLQPSTENRAALRNAVENLRGKTGATDFTEALALATPSAERLPDTAVVIVGDGAFAPPASLDLRAPLRFIRVGERAENLGITAAATRRAANGAELFVRVQNFGATEKKTLLSIYDGETLIEARALTVPSGGEAGATIALPPAVGLLRAEIDAPDDLALDNRVWVRPGGNKGRVLITSAGPNTFLERGLALQPNIVVEQAQGSSTPAGGGDYDLYVFDGVAPPADLRGPVLLINPPADNGLVTVAGGFTRPVVTNQLRDDPIMKGVDLAKIQIADAQALDRPDWARSLIDSNDRSLLLAGETGGRRIAVLAFGLGRSDLPLTLSYPILLANLVGWLAPEAGSGLPETISPGTVVSIAPRSGVDRVVVTDPNGREQRLAPSRGVALYNATDTLGAYTVREFVGDREIKRSVMTVNLLSADESSIAPQTPQLTSAAQNTAGGGTIARARQEAWRPLLAIALLILAIEWWIFYRGGWRSLGTITRDFLRDPRAPFRALIRNPQSAFRNRQEGRPMTLRFEQPLLLLALLLLPLLIPVALYHAERSVRGRRIAASVVRLILVASAVIALAGPTIVRETDRLATIFLVDASDSVGPNGVAGARDFIKASLATMPDGDTAGIVLFGDNALVERSLSEDPELGPLLSTPRTGYSDLAGAVRLGLALFPEGSARRLVLISDGQETKGDLGAAAAAAAASGVEISTRTIASARGDEALVSDLRAPSRAREGEAVDIAVTVQSTVAGAARLRIFVDGDLVREQAIDLKVGDNRYGFTIPPIGAGFHRFKAEVAAGADTFWQNNSASAYTDIKGRARVLILEGVPNDGANIAAALRAGGYVVDTLPADRAPTNLAELVPYDAVVMVNTPAEALGSRAAVLQSYTRDLGRGLVVVGGDKAYGPGGYSGTVLEEMLPVRMELRNGVVNPPVSLVFAIDKSGSMSGGGGGGVSKMDLAKEAAYRAVKLLQPQDEIGIAAFDGSAYVVADRKPVRDQPNIGNLIGSLQASGGTDIRAGLEAALGLQAGSAGRVRHIILVTDGQSDNNFDDLIKQLTEAGITLSVIGVGSDVAPYLPQLAASGNGRYYFAQDPAQLPEIFLQETRLALRSYFIEGDIGLRFGAATPITEGIEAAPNLLGYVGTTAKPTAQVGLLSADGDPLLAQWQYGLGRVVAWTSDAKGQWATNWLTWPEFTRFWSRAVGWTVATAPQDLQLATRTEGDRTILTVDALDPTGAYRNGLAVGGTTIGPDGARREVTLRQIAPGRYEGDLGTLLEGAHLLAIVARDGQGNAQAGTSGGLIVPYSPEYALPRGDRAVLTRARELTGGIELTDPAAAFAHTLPRASQSTAIWPPFLLAAILLLPFDIALRRLLIGRRDFQAVAARLFRRPAPPEPTIHERGTSSATMGNLLAARERMQDRWAGKEIPLAAPPPAPKPAAQAAPPRGIPTTPPAAPRPAAPAAAQATKAAAPVPTAQRAAPPPRSTAPQTGGTLGQLLKAKEEAKRRRE